ERIEIGAFGLDGGRITPLDGNVLRARNRIRFEGEAVVSVVVDGKGRLVADPRVSAPTLLDDEEHADDLADIADQVADAVEGLPKASRADDGLLQEVVRTALRRGFRELLGKRPLTVVHLLRV
ncbi:MAG: hypothetical protein WD270_07675, partial [Acetobacterales bacterium]